MARTFSSVKVLPQVKRVNTKKRRKVGILGGTFNPIHNGHLIIAEQVLDRLGLDEVRFMPDANPPHVDRKFAIDARHRVTMIAGSIRDNPHFFIEMEEIIRGGISYTVDTMEKLTKQHPENDYYFIIGGDMVAYLPKWHDIDKLINLVHFVGVRRTGFPQTSNYPIIWVDVPYIQISSSNIRQRIHQRHAIKYLVPDFVEKYIKENHLYEN